MRGGEPSTGAGKIDVRPGKDSFKRKEEQAFTNCTLKRKTTKRRKAGDVNMHGEA